MFAEVGPSNGHARPLNGHAYRAERAEPVSQQAPHNLEAEQAVLGAILFDNAVMARVSSFLEPHHFFESLHQQIFETAARLIAEGKRADPITLRPFFERAEPISPTLTVPQYLGTLLGTPTIVNAEDYARAVCDLATRRPLIIIGEDLFKGAREHLTVPVYALIREAKGLLSEVEASIAGWPEPDSSILHRVQEAAPRMPLEGFGPTLAVHIESAASALGAPIDYVGLALLCGAAGMIGARRAVEAWPGWKEPAILWGALVGDPSTNKSPAIDPVREALNGVEAEKLEQFKPESARGRRRSGEGGEARMGAGR
jgi:hypothetical protein